VHRNAVYSLGDGLGEKVVRRLGTHGPCILAKRIKSCGCGERKRKKSTREKNLNTTVTQTQKGLHILAQQAFQQGLGERGAWGGF